MHGNTDKHTYFIDFWIISAPEDPLMIGGGLFKKTTGMKNNGSAYTMYSAMWPSFATQNLHCSTTSVYMILIPTLFYEISGHFHYYCFFYSSFPFFFT